MSRENLEGSGDKENTKEKNGKTVCLAWLAYGVYVYIYI